MSRFQAEASVSHSRILLLFTIVTIIFLPLSFLASWFGMNIDDPKAGSLKLYQIAAIAMAFAISEKLRGLAVRVVEFCWTVFSGSGLGGEDERIWRDHHGDSLEIV